MDLKSCNYCGVVVDVNVACLSHDILFNHDGDMYCDAVVCPVCKELIEAGDWEDYE